MAKKLVNKEADYIRILREVDTMIINSKYRMPISDLLKLQEVLRMLKPAVLNSTENVTQDIKNSHELD